MVSKASEDFPEPERPVNTTNLSRGISTVTSLRLCSRAPRMTMVDPGGVIAGGTLESSEGRSAGSAASARREGTDGRGGFDACDHDPAGTEGRVRHARAWITGGGEDEPGDRRFGSHVDGIDRDPSGRQEVGHGGVCGSSFVPGVDGCRWQPLIALLRGGITA